MMPAEYCRLPVVGAVTKRTGWDPAVELVEKLLLEVQ
jgi:hypothetical protein